MTFDKQVPKLSLLCVEEGLEVILMSEWLIQIMPLGYLVIPYNNTSNNVACWNMI